MHDAHILHLVFIEELFQFLDRHNVLSLSSPQPTPVSPGIKRRNKILFHHMSDIIYPRSPRETMDGWHYLPRYIDKIRLHLAGKLHADYQDNFGKGFDGFWLKAAGVSHEQFIAIVKNTVTDGEVCDW